MKNKTRLQTGAVNSPEGSVPSAEVERSGATDRATDRAAVAGTDLDFQRLVDQLRANVQSMRLIVDTANEAFISMDADGVVIDWNPQAETTFGWSRAEVLGRRVADTIVPPQHRQSHRRGLGRFLAARESQMLNRRLEITALHRDEHEFPVELTVAAVPRGDSFIFHAFLHDITRRKRAEDALAESNAQLQQFAYAVSHDLQEPLRMVISYCQLLQRRYQGKLDADADDFIHFAVDGATRMQTLIQDLLTYSHVQQAEPFTQTDCGEVLQTALHSLQASVRATGATVSHGDLPTLMADGALVGLVFQNLIGNAIKYRGAEPPVIHVDARQEEGRWVFSVRDNGIGIESGDTDRIFTLFKRLHGRSKYPGTGIGLATCKRAVERHGGRIWVESQPGVGSTFYFSLATSRETVP